MKKIIILILTFLLLSGCASIYDDKNCQNDIMNDETEYYIENITVDYILCKDLQELIEKSGIICKATVNDSEVKKISYGLGTITEFKITTVLNISVEKCYKGNIKEGEIIQLAQNGGKFDSKKTIMNYTETKYLNNNETYLLFMYDYTDYENKPNYLVNPIQGCYVIDENNNITPYNGSNIIINSIEDLNKICSEYSKNPEKAKNEKRDRLLKEKELYEKILSGDKIILEQMNFFELNDEIRKLCENEIKRVDELLSKIK